MLPTVTVGCHNGTADTNFDVYRPIVGDTLVDEILELSRDLGGVRVCHLNSTAHGGGVAELLARIVPMETALGLAVDWRLMDAPPAFFDITKAFHNALQGAPRSLDASERQLYLDVNRACAERLPRDYDVFIVHDPQPAALRAFDPTSRARWAWRCHIDTSAPNDEVAAFLHPYLHDYDSLIFTMPDFRLPQLNGQHVGFIAPAIDPLATKNMDVPAPLCRKTMADAGIDTRRPVLLQVSRFDPWKDPLGVIGAYRLVKREIPDVQLVLIGALAGDDPEGWHLLAQVQDMAARDRDLFVFTNLGGVGNLEVNAFQRGSDVVIQKSLREGFGLVVAEALWKETPVVAGRTGGIPMQFPDGFERCLVDSVDGCAAAILDLLKHPRTRVEFGRAGREHVRQSFLMPRLIRDELRLIRQLLGRDAAGRRPRVNGTKPHALPAGPALAARSGSNGSRRCKSGLASRAARARAHASAALNTSA